MREIVSDDAFVLFGVRVRCYVLDDGQRILNGDDVNRLFERMGEKDCPLPERSQVVAFGKWWGDEARRKLWNWEAVQRTT